MSTRESRSDLLLAAGVLVLLVARFGLAGGDGDLEPSFLAATAVSVALCGAAGAPGAALSGAVRALLAAIAFSTFAVDPTTGYDERNFVYGVCATVFAAVAVVRVGRRGQIEAARTEPDGRRAVATATWVAGALLLAGAATFVGVMIVLVWALSGDPS